MKAWQIVVVVVVTLFIAAAGVGIGLWIKFTGAPPPQVAARYLPAEPVAVMAARDGREVFSAVEKSQWWTSLVAMVFRDPEVGRIWRRLQNNYHRLSGGGDLKSHLGTLKRLVGGEVLLAVYSGYEGRDLQLILALTPKDPPDRTVAFNQISQFYRAIKGGRLRVGREPYRRGTIFTLSANGRPVYIYVHRGRTVYATQTRTLMTDIIDRISGLHRGPILAEDKLFQETLAAGPDGARFFVMARLDRAPLAFRGRIRRDISCYRDNWWVRGRRHQIFSNPGELFHYHAQAAILASTLTRTVVGLKLKPGSALAAAIDETPPTGDLVTVDMIPGAPLVYTGQRFPLARALAGLVRDYRLVARRCGGRGRIIVPTSVLDGIARFLGYARIEDVIANLGDEMAVAVMSVPSSGLPIPRMIYLARMSDEKTARDLLHRLVQRLKGLPQFRMLPIRSRRVDRSTVQYVVAPFVGEIGVVRRGSFWAFSNDLRLLGDLVQNRSGRSSDAWSRAKRRRGNSAMTFIDTGRILEMVPTILAQAGLYRRMGRTEQEQVNFLLDVFKFLRSVTMWSNWDGRQRLLKLVVDLEVRDHRVATQLSPLFIRVLSRPLR
jgi:hypothetical protein